MRYAVINQNDTVENVILWDGVTEFDPGEGYQLVPDDGTAEINGQYAGGVFMPAQGAERPKVT